MNAIVAADENWAIGRDGKLLVHLSGDLKYYRRRTEGHHIVIGRRTLESFPGGRPLPHRENIVLTGNERYHRPDCTVCYSLTQLLLYLAGLPDEEIFVSGGATVYRQLLPYCSTVYVTHIRRAFAGADCHFPDLTADDAFRMTDRSAEREEQGVRYYFATYQRIG
ncbi:MAG: dihydrofolate reductase [Anaerovoracaceae bacterium]|jgi:dihydrofolate reductase